MWSSRLVNPEDRKLFSNSIWQPQIVIQLVSETKQQYGKPDLSFKTLKKDFYDFYYYDYFYYVFSTLPYITSNRRPMYF